MRRPMRRRIVEDLLGTKINAGLMTDLFEDTAQHVLRLLFRLSQVYPVQEIVEQRPNLFDFHLEVYHRGGRANGIEG